MSQMLLPVLVTALLSAAVTEIAATVVDQSGGLVAGAQYTLAGPSGQVLTGTTDQIGTFRHSGLEAGVYRVRIEHSGFKITGIQVKLATEPVSLRIVLRIADFRQQLTVRNPGTNVSAGAGENQDVIRLDRNALNKLPVLGNNIVGAAAELLDQGAIGAGGVSLVVDGMETTKIGVSASAIQEVRINQNPYSAEYARPGRGRIEITTQAAMEEFHGSGEFAFRDSRMDARNAFAGTRPPEQRRMLEGHFTGPLGKSRKMAFLISGNHEEEDLQNLVYAFTPAGTVRQNAPNLKRQTEFSGKVTRQIIDRQTLSLRYELGRDQGKGEGVGGFTLPEAATQYTEREHNVFVNYQAVLAPRVVNEFTMRITRQSLENRDTLAGTAQIVVQDAFTGGGAQAGRHETQNRVQLNNVLSWTRGKHLVKAGVSIPGLNRRGLNDLGMSEGRFSFSTLQDYALGRPYLFEVQRGIGYLTFWHKEIGLYVQDDFKPRPHLLIGIGVRYDWQNFLSDHNNVAPRLSVAYGLGKARQTVLRGGSGVFFDRTGNSPIADVLRLDGFHLRQYLVENPGYPDPFTGSAGLQATPVSVTRFARDLRTPYLLQYSGGAERQLRKALVLTANYTGMTGVKSFRSRDGNAPEPPLYSARPIAGIAVLRLVESAGRLQSHSFDVALRGEVGDLFNGTAQYSLGRAYNNTGGVGWYPADSYDLSGEWARANFDQRQRLRALSTFKAGDWFDLGTILTMNTGAPYTVTTGRDENHDGRASDRPAGIPRNSRQGFGLASFDVKLSHEFKLTREDKDEAPSVEAGLEAFNLFNRVNYTTVIGNLSSPFFGQAVASRPARRLEIKLEFKF